jgi:hypothetical protein
MRKRKKKYEYVSILLKRIKLRLHFIRVFSGSASPSPSRTTRPSPLSRTVNRPRPRPHDHDRPLQPLDTTAASHICLPHLSCRAAGVASPIRAAVVAAPPIQRSGVPPRPAVRGAEAGSASDPYASSSARRPRLRSRASSSPFISPGDSWTAPRIQNLASSSARRLRRRSRMRPLHLRKSLAWDSAFFTSKALFYPGQCP